MPNWTEYSKKFTYLSKEKFDYRLNSYVNLFKFFKINTKKMKILEIGCGHGIETLILSKLFKKITAIDKEKSLINLLKEKIENINNIEPLIRKCENIKFNKKFNMIICNNNMGFL